MDVSRMLAIIGLYGFSDTDTTTLVDMINEAYHDICSLEAWPFLEKQITLTFDGTSDVPTNFPSDFGSVITIVDTSSGIGLDPMRIEEHYRRHAVLLTLQGNPLYYWFLNNTMHVYPIPSAQSGTNNLVMNYVSDEPDLTNTTLSAQILLPAAFHWAIIYSVLSALYLEEDDEAQSDYFQNRADRKIARMRERLWRHHFDRADTIEVLDDDADYYAEPGFGVFQG